MELLRQKECAKTITIYGHNGESDDIIFTISDKTLFTGITISNQANQSEFSFRFTCMSPMDYNNLKDICEKQVYWTFTAKVEEIWYSVETGENKVITRTYGPFNRIILTYDIENGVPTLYTVNLNNN